MSKPIYKHVNYFALTITFLVAVTIWFWPVPQDVPLPAWHLLAIFVGLIVGLILKALPMGGLSFLALTILVTTQTLTLKQAFSGFANPIVWLVVAAFLLSRSFIKTGLGMRIAYYFVTWFGRKTLGLGYSTAATELLLAPIIPSNTARSGGVVYPIVRALAISFGSTPEKHTQRWIGSFLILTAYYCSLISSALFVTAMAANPLIVGILQDSGVNVGWTQWFLAASLPAFLSILIIPLLVYVLYPPKIKETPDARKIALRHLEEMGPMSLYEKVTLGIFILLILLWIFGEQFFGIESTTVALIGVSLLILTNILNWNDIKQEHEAWDALIWFSTLLMMATFLNEFGLIKWIAGHIQSMLGDLTWHYAWPLLVLIYFYSHYLFASNTAHVTSIFGAFFSVGLALGTPPYLMGFSLAFISSLFACLTHYGTGSAPILFGSEYVDLKTWWRMGALVSVVFLLIWVGIGSLWWKFLGYY